jgi:hypothetical protein
MLRKILKITLISFIIIALIGSVAFFQFMYDLNSVSASSVGYNLSPQLTHFIDFGFDPQITSFSWITNMPEILDLFNNRDIQYFSDLNYTTGVDPKMSYPYAFSVITLPMIKSLHNSYDIANAIGENGIKFADPDWRIPFYMATNYYLGLHNKEEALRYYDLTSRTPGVPSTTQRFAINFSIGFGSRDYTKSLWETIRDTTKDEFLKERAQAYIDRLNDLDYLELAAKQYKNIFGVFPKTPDDLVSKNIIPELPKDPFGFNFIFDANGVASIDVAHPPVNLPFVQ